MLQERQKLSKHGLLGLGSPNPTDLDFFFSGRFVLTRIAGVEK